MGHNSIPKVNIETELSMQVMLPNDNFSENFMKIDTESNQDKKNNINRKE